MVIVGSNPPNRFTEQHDVFFGIATSIAELKEAIYDFWTEAGERIHIDSYRKVFKVDNYIIKVIDKNESTTHGSDLNLYFLNLGGYKPLDMEEYHYKQLVVATSMDEAIAVAEQNTFSKHHENPHVDNKYGIDVDDAYLVEDMLSPTFKAKYKIQIETLEDHQPDDELAIGYLKLSEL